MTTLVAALSPLRPNAVKPRVLPAPVLSADRSFKVLQPSRTPAQLSLFPPPGLNRAAR